MVGQSHAFFATKPQRATPVLAIAIVDEHLFVIDKSLEITSVNRLTSAKRDGFSICAADFTGLTENRIDGPDRSAKNRYFDVYFYEFFDSIFFDHSNRSRIFRNPFNEYSESENIFDGNLGSDGTVTPTNAELGQNIYDQFWREWVAHQDFLLRRCLYMMAGNRADAEDVLGAAMIRAAENYAASAPTIRNQRAWLTRLVYNACIDHLRKAQTRRRFAKARIDDDDAPGVADFIPGIDPPPSPSPEEMLVRRQFILSVDREIQNLAMPLRRPLVLRFLQGSSYREIADDMGLTNAAIRKRVQLARDTIRHNLQHESPFGVPRRL